MQEEEKLRSIEQYDLDLKPKLKKSDRVKSVSMPNVQAVKPVDSVGSSKWIQQVKAFDSPKVPIKKKPDAQINAAIRIEDFAIANKLQKLDGRNIERKKVRKTLPFSNR